MTPERWQQVKQIFNSALERPAPERAVFVSDACAGDEVLLSEVESLLSSHGKEGQFIDAPAYEVAANVLVNSKASVMAAGENLGSYRLLSTLGRGGMGEVYLAEDSRLGRKVALKLLPSSFTNDPDRLARFEREARAASALNHPNILTIYEVGASNGRQFIAAEFVDGETLRQRQLHSPLKPNEILDVAVQVASALSAAHQAGIVHRDIKPENIMIRRDGYVKVVDFGLAKLTETGRPRSDTSAPTMLQVDTDTGMVLGTTAYMSPEQARGQQLDQRTDIWSFGVVLYELLSGATPFKGNTPSDLIVAILDREPAPLAASPVLPSELDWMVRKALRKDRDERYQTAREMLGDLRSLKQQLDYAAQSGRSGSPAVSSTAEMEPSVPSKTTTGESAMPTHEASPVHTAIEPASKSHGSIRNYSIAGAVAFAVVLGAFAVYKFWVARPASSHFASMKITRITNSGKAINSVLSPDGKYLVYVLSDAAKQSIWIRQVSTANDKEIVPAAPVGVFGMALTPDGNELYYVIKQNLDAGTLYRVPVFGGTSTKVLERIDADPSFSPDGSQFVFIRNNHPGTGETSLLIANRDGTGERTLATRKPPDFFTPIFFTGPSWSPDGKLIAVSSARVGARVRVVAFAVQDGTEQSLSPDAWPFAARVQWLPDMSGLILVAGEAAGTAQLWHLSYPGGVARPITNDLNSYRAIGLDAAGDKLTTVQTSGLINIWIVPDGDVAKAVQLPTGNVGFYGSNGNTVGWTPDDNIVFASNESGRADIWIMDSQGRNRKQLTANAGNNLSPVMSSDGRYIVFISSRAGSRNIWRMDARGNDPRRLTKGASDYFPAISPDGKWVVYTSLTDGKPTLWRVSIDGGDPVQLVSRVAVAPAFSPDGKFIAYLYPESPDPLAPSNRIAIISSEGGEPLKTFEMDFPRRVTPIVQWTTDGKNLVYPVTTEITNLWSQSIDGGKPKQLTQFKDNLMTGFAWSRDGKTLACTRGIQLRDAVLISDVR